MIGVPQLQDVSYESTGAAIRRRSYGCDLLSCSIASKVGMNRLLVLAVITSATLSLVTNSLIRSLARINGWAAGPRSKRHIHHRPTPRLGGVGVFVSSLVMTAVLAFFLPDLLSTSKLIHLFAPATVMFAVGLWDDIRPLSAKFKLLVQIGCGCALFHSLSHTSIGQTFGTGQFAPTILLFSIIAWTVIVSNSINLIDGIDGLAGGTAALSLAAVAFVAMRGGQWGVVLIAAVLVGSIIGFLRFNVNPASMFLGDGGSLFLGYMIAALSVSWSGSRALTGTIVVAVAILALPLAETGVSVIRRFLSGRPIFAPDREHIHHKLLDRGLSQREAAFCLHAVAIICGVSGIGIASGNFLLQVVCSFILVVVLVFGILALGYAEFVEVGRVFTRIVEQRRVLANNVAMRKVAVAVEESRCLAMIGEELRSTLKNLNFDGFELIINPASMDSISRCKLRSDLMHWGYTQNTRAIDPACFRVGFDLSSERYGKMGWVVLTRKVDKGSPLLDSSVLLTELLPSIVLSLERCLNSSCIGCKIPAEAPLVRRKCATPQQIGIPAGAPQNP